MTDVKGRMAVGAAWMVLLKIVERGIGLASTVVLARLLLPADFGVVAMATSIIAILELFGALGLDWALIQRPDATPANYNAAWTFSAIFGVSCAIALLCVAAPAATFYGEPRLVPVMQVLAGMMAIGGFQNIGIVAFRRDLEFDREFRFLLAKKIATVVVTILLAFTLRSYWALVIGVTFGSAMSVALSYYVHPYRPRLSLHGLGELLRFSKWLLANNALLFLNARASDFVIGRLSGAGALGMYQIAYEISNLPTTELVAPINKATFPGYSRLAGDIVKLRDGFLNVTSMVALITLPAGCGIALVADSVVPVFLGGNWLSAIPIIQVLALYGVISALQTNIGYVYAAIGKPRLMTFVSSVQLIVMLIGLFLLAPTHGALGAAWAFLITALLLVPVNQALIIFILGISTRIYLASVWRPIVAAAGMCVAVLILRAQMSSPANFGQHVLHLSVLSVCGALTYAGLVLGFWKLAGRPDGPERYCVDAVRRALGRGRFSSAVASSENSTK